MNATIVPLAEMTPALHTVRGVELTAAPGELVVLHGDAARKLVDRAGDALVMAIAGDDELCGAIDFRRARALIAHEVRGARGGPVHLASVYVYLTQLVSEARARGIVEQVAEVLRGLGARPEVPQSAKRNAMRARRRAHRPAPRSRRARGTRSVSLLTAIFGL
jgi:hypothetical protein